MKVIILANKMYEAVLKDEKAVNTVINDGSIHYKQDGEDVKVTPRTARLLLKRGIVQSPHDFECATKGCHAPVTCCSFRPYNKKDTYYMTPPEQRNLHIEACHYHVSQTQTYSEKEAQKQYEIDKGKRIVSTFDIHKGFEGTASSKSQDNVAVTKSEDSEDSETLTRNVYNHNQDNDGIRKVKSDIKFKSVREYVELFYQDPEAIIVSPDTGKSIKNKYLYTSISNNKLYSDVKPTDYFRIYKAEITLRPMKNGDFVGWIKPNVEINGQSLQPSIFLNKQFIKSQYPTKFEEYQTDGFIKCDIYLSYKLYFDENNSYLNFAQFGTGNQLKSNAHNIKYNIYLV
jgi:hypothetical protein